ncbi:hypothetical protein, partial [Yersinia enterocolitica]|uniref:hypothetical protein n=1 Tax=Yersinia enterocolitica TaxID=630 RepID=UPI00313AAD24
YTVIIWRYFSHGAQLRLLSITAGIANGKVHDWAVKKKPKFYPGDSLLRGHKLRLSNSSITIIMCC